MLRLSLLKSVGLPVVATVLTFACPLKAGAQEAALAVSAVPAPAAKRLVTGTIDDTRLVAFNAQPIPASKDLGRLSPSTPMAMQVVLRRSMEQQRALGLLEKATHDPNSPQFGKTLGPAEFAQTFGLAGSDLQAITDWLTGKGFEVVSVDNGRMAINVRGTAAQVEAAFHTEMHQYAGTDGATHYANSTAIQVPRAMFAAFGGVNGIENFEPMRLKGFGGPVTDFAVGTTAEPTTIADASPAAPKVAAAVKLQGDALRDASFTASKYSMVFGNSALLNVRLGGDKYPATGSLLVTDDHGNSIAYIADISACSPYNGALGRSCNLNFKPSFAGTSTLTALYSGDAHYKGDRQQIIIAHAGPTPSYSVITASPVMFYTGAGSVTFTTVISYAGSVEPSGTYTVTVYDIEGNLDLTLAAVNLSTCVTTLADNLLTCTSNTTSAKLANNLKLYTQAQFDVEYNGDANYAASVGFTTGYFANGAGTYTPTLTVAGSFATAETYGTSVNESGVTSFTDAPASGGPDPGYENAAGTVTCFPFVNFTGPLQLGNLGTINAYGCTSTTGSCQVTLSEPAFTLPSVVTPGTYAITGTYSGDTETGISSTYCTNGPETSKTALSVTINEQTPTATMTTSAYATPAPVTTQTVGALAAFQVYGTLAWTGVGVPPVVSDLAFTSTAAGTFSNFTCAVTYTNSTNVLAATPYDCSATFTPTASDPTGTYTIKLGYTTDGVNYNTTASTTTGNYIIQGPATSIVLALTPGGYSAGSVSAGVTSTSITATITAASANGNFTGTVLFTKTYTGGVYVLGPYAVTKLTATTASVVLPLSTSSAGISAGLDSFTAQYSDTGNYSSSPVSNTLPLYFDGVLFSTWGYHNFSGLTSYSTAYPTVEGTIDGTLLQYGVTIINFTNAPISLPFTFTPVSGSVAFTYTTNCPTAPAKLPAFVYDSGVGGPGTCQYLFSYDPPAGDGCTPGTTCTKDDSGYYQGTYESAGWAITVPTGTQVGVGDSFFDRSGPAAASGTLEGKAVLPAGTLSISPSTTSAAPYSFGTLAPNEVSGTKTFTVTNPNASLTQFTYTAPAAPFTATNNCVSPLAAGATCNIQVSVSSATANAYTGNFVLTPNGGTAVKTYLSATVTAATGLTLTTNAHNFGNIQTGTSATFGLNITNNSTTTAANLTFSNTAGTGYSIVTTGCPNPLPKSSSCQVQVTFAPATGATVNTQVTDSLTVKSTTFAILPGGTGTAGAYQSVVTFTGTPVNTGEFTATSVAHDFGAVVVGASGGNYGVELTNSTSSAVTLAFSGLTNTAAGFSLVGSSCGTSLAVNASCELVFTYDPTTGVAATGTYPITSSAPLYSGGAVVSPQQITLYGSGQQ